MPCNDSPLKVLLLQGKVGMNVINVEDIMIGEFEPFDVVNIKHVNVDDQLVDIFNVNDVGNLKNP